MNKNVLKSKSYSLKENIHILLTKLKDKCHVWKKKVCHECNMQKINVYNNPYKTIR